MPFDDELSFFLKPSKTPAKGEGLELGLLDLWLSDPIGEFEPTDRGLLELSEDPDFFEEKKSFVFLNTISDFATKLPRRRGRATVKVATYKSFSFFFF